MEEKYSLRKILDDIKDDEQQETRPQNVKVTQQDIQKMLAEKKKERKE